jgi:hypothetical protein
VDSLNIESTRECYRWDVEQLYLVVKDSLAESTAIEISGTNKKNLLHSTKKVACRRLFNRL